MHLTSFPRIALTLLLALATAATFLALHAPLPWMIGPLLATAIASMCGAPTQSATPLRNAGQLTIGVALGLYFTPQVTQLVASVWWAILLGIVWALGVGTLFGAWLYRIHAPRMTQLAQPAMRATAFFAGSIGGASEMTLLSEREHARTDLVAAAHSLRLLVVTLTVPFAFTFSGLHGLDLTPPGPREVHWDGLALLVAVAVAASLAVRRMGRANPWFLGAMVSAMAFTMSGINLSAFPQWWVNAAQLVIGVSLGVRFRSEFIHTAPRWLATVAAGTLGMIVVCGIFAYVLSIFTGIHPATLILGTSPGGIAEMAITAKVLQLGVPVVTAFQVCRLIAVLILMEPVYRFLYKKPARTPPRAGP